MAISEKKNHKLGIYLIKREIVDFNQVLKKRPDVKEYLLKKSLKLDGRLYLGDTKDTVFGWQDLLQQGVDETLPQLTNSSNRAVLLLRVQLRIYAIPFGFGKHLLREETIEREFGLKTALNIVDSEKLRSIDKANLSDLSVLVRTQTSRRAKPEEFDLSSIRDFMRGVTGEPSPDYGQLGNVVTGSEGLYILPKIEFEDIATHLATLAKGYSSKRYKARFDWVDNIKAERDPVIIETLQEKLVDDLKAQNEEKIHLSPSTIIEWEGYEGFSLTRKGDLQTELDISTFYTVKKDSLNELDWDRLKSMRLYLKFSNLHEAVVVSILQSIHYETQVGKNVFVFAFGVWYKVNRNYAQEIRTDVEKLQESKVRFNDCASGMSEGDYNTALANSNSNFILFDKDLVGTDVNRSRIEVCDVFSKQEKEFIHIKFKAASSTLSHLFAQGKISADLLARDKAFRANLRAKLKSLGHPMNIIPLEESKLQTSTYTVTYAVIAKGTKSFAECLPFFSLLNLRLTAEELRLLGYKVKVKKINEV